MKQEKVTFEANTTVAATNSEIERFEKIINSDQIKSLSNTKLLQYKLELARHQTNAIMLKEYFIPEVKAYGTANVAKVLIEMIGEEMKERNLHLVAIKNYFYERNKENWHQIMEEIKTNR